MKKNKIIMMIIGRVMVYATHETAIIWYRYKPNEISWYKKEIDKKDLYNNVYNNMK